MSVADGTTLWTSQFDENSQTIFADRFYIGASRGEVGYKLSREEEDTTDEALHGTPKLINSI